MIWEVERETKAHVHVDLDIFIEHNRERFEEWFDDDADPTEEDKREFLGEASYEMDWYELFEGPWIVKNVSPLEEGYNFTQIDGPSDG